MQEAQVYFYQERTERKPDGRLEKRVVGSQLVVGGEIVVETQVPYTFLDRRLGFQDTESMGRYIAGCLSRRYEEGKTFSDRKIEEGFKVFLYKRFQGDCIAQDEFCPIGVATGLQEGKIFKGDDIVGHMWQGFVHGLCLGNKEKYLALADKLAGSR